MQIEVATEDRSAVTGPVKIGIGTTVQFPALHRAGADRVQSSLWVRETMADAPDIMSMVFRPEDTIIMVQPDLLTVAEIKELVRMTRGFTVPTVDLLFRSTADTLIREFRKVRPTMEVQRQENRGGKVLYPQPDEGQMQSLITLWQTGPRSHAAVEQRAKEIMGAWVPATWVRDKVLGKTGSAARKPTKEIEG